MKTIDFGKVNPLQKLMEKGVHIICQPYLPPRTIMCSTDIYDELSKMGKTVETVEGEVVREAQKQLEDGDGPA